MSEKGSSWRSLTRTTLRFFYLIGKILGTTESPICLLEDHKGKKSLTLPSRISQKLTAKAPENKPGPKKETIVFPPSIFRYYVSFREGRISPGTEHLRFFFRPKKSLATETSPVYFGDAGVVGVALWESWCCRCGSCRGWECLKHEEGRSYSFSRGQYIDNPNFMHYSKGHFFKITIDLYCLIPPRCVI